MSTNTASHKVMLYIPVRTLTHNTTYDTKLIVGPFDNEEAAKAWEAELARGLIDETSPDPGYVEGRSVYGRGARAVTGYERAELQIGISTKNKSHPDKVFVVVDAEIVKVGDVLPIPTINANKVSGSEVGRNFSRYMSQALQQA